MKSEKDQIDCGWLIKARTGVNECDAVPDLSKTLIGRRLTATSGCVSIK